MTRNSLRNVTCSIARTVDILGDAWAWLIVRDVFLGVCRFDDLCADLGISRKVLAQRLSQLSDAGIIAKVRQTDEAKRSEYALTDKGRDLVPILATLVTWGDRWEPTTGGPPMYFEHSDCGATSIEITCGQCGDPVTAGTLTVRPGHGGSLGSGTAVVGHRLLALSSAVGEPHPAAKHHAIP